MDKKTLIDKIEDIKMNKKSILGRKPILCLDQDDVLAQHNEEVIERYNKKYGTNFCSEDIISWDMTSIMGKQVEKIMFVPEMFKDLKIVDNCYDYLKILYESDLFEIFIVTAAHPASCGYKYNWVKEKLPFFNKKNMIFTNRKDLVNGDLLLDDGPHNIIAFKKDVVIMDKPYNRNIEGFDRITNWNQFPDLVLDKFYK